MGCGTASLLSQSGISSKSSSWSTSVPFSFELNVKQNTNESVKISIIILMALRIILVLNKKFHNSDIFLQKQPSWAVFFTFFLAFLNVPRMFLLENVFWKYFWTIMRNLRTNQQQKNFRDLARVFSFKKIVYFQTDISFLILRKLKNVSLVNFAKLGRMS